jgi:hypothetical protein
VEKKLPPLKSKTSTVISSVNSVNSVNENKLLISPLSLNNSRNNSVEPDIVSLENEPDNIFHSYPKNLYYATENYEKESEREISLKCFQYYLFIGCDVDVEEANKTVNEDGVIPADCIWVYVCSLDDPGVEGWVPAEYLRKYTKDDYDYDFGLLGRESLSHAELSYDEHTISLDKTENQLDFSFYDDFLKNSMITEESKEDSVENTNQQIKKELEDESFLEVKQFTTSPPQAEISPLPSCEINKSSNPPNTSPFLQLVHSSQKKSKSFSSSVETSPSSTKSSSSSAESPSSSTESPSSSTESSMDFSNSTSSPLNSTSPSISPSHSSSQNSPSETTSHFKELLQKFQKKT